MGGVGVQLGEETLSSIIDRGSESRTFGFPIQDA